MNFAPKNPPNGGSLSDAPVAALPADLPLRDATAPRETTVETDAPKAKRGRVAYLPALDGMRGVAACVVLVYHVVLFFSLNWGPLNGSWLAPHSYLVVDCFYAMSGFVMAHAFDDKLERGMSFSLFARHRFVRLYPMILAGTVLGAVTLLALWKMTPGMPLLSVLEAIAAGAFVIPTTAMSAYKPYDFPVNSPFWSLSYEVILCIGYAATFRLLRDRRILAAAIAVAAIAVGIVAWLKGGLDIGFRNGEYGMAFGRVVYPFLVGMFIRRLPSYRPESHALGYLAIPLLLAAVVNPFPPGAIYDTVVVLAVIPGLVWLAAGAKPVRGFDGAAAALGTLSYPLYALHFPIVVSLSNAAKKLGFDGNRTLMLALLALVAAIAISVLIYVVYDKPLRRFLARRLIA